MSGDESAQYHELELRVLAAMRDGLDEAAFNVLLTQGPEAVTRAG